MRLNDRIHVYLQLIIKTEYNADATRDSLQQIMIHATHATLQQVIIIKDATCASAERESVNKGIFCRQ